MGFSFFLHRHQFRAFVYRAVPVFYIFSRQVQQPGRHSSYSWDPESNPVLQRVITRYLNTDPGSDFSLFYMPSLDNLADCPSRFSPVLICFHTSLALIAVSFTVLFSRLLDLCLPLVCL